MQSSSHSCPRDTSDPVIKSSNINAFWPLGERCLDRGASPCLTGVMISPFATVTSGLLASRTFVQMFDASFCKKCVVAALSSNAVFNEDRDSTELVLLQKLFILASILVSVPTFQFCVHPLVLPFCLLANVAVAM